MNSDHLELEPSGPYVLLGRIVSGSWEKDHSCTLKPTLVKWLGYDLMVILLVFGPLILSGGFVGLEG